jgi:putative flippase GtrA
MAPADKPGNFRGLAVPACLLRKGLRLMDARCDIGADDGRKRESGFSHLAIRVWEQKFRLVIFATNGVNVFAAGLLIQVILVRYAGMGHVSSYIAQTIVSVQMSFLLSRFLTWGDRKMAILPALAKFNMQQLIVTGLGMAGYAGLEQLGMNYIVANVAVTAVLTPVSFLSSHKWSLISHQRKFPHFVTREANTALPDAARRRSPRTRRTVVLPENSGDLTSGRNDYYYVPVHRRAASRQSTGTPSWRWARR